MDLVQVVGGGEGGREWVRGVGARLRTYGSTHPKGCVQSAGGLGTPPKDVYRVLGVWGPPPKDVYRVLGVWGPTPKNVDVLKSAPPPQARCA